MCLCVRVYVCVCVCMCGRLVEEIKQKCGGVQLQNEDVYMATSFQEFIQMFVRHLRGEDQEEELIINYVSVKHTNNPSLTLTWHLKKTWNTDIHIFQFYLAVVRKLHDVFFAISRQQKTSITWRWRCLTSVSSMGSLRMQRMERLTTLSTPPMAL